MTTDFPSSADSDFHGFRDFARSLIEDRRKPWAPTCVSVFGAFARTRRDREAEARASRCVTAKLMGDPKPGRVVPDLLPETRQGIRDPEPAPIYLTFAAMRAAYGIQEQSDAND